MKIKAFGWFFLIIGGIGVHISAAIGSDWPMYACTILSSTGAALLISTVCYKGSSKQQAR